MEAHREAVGGGRNWDRLGAFQFQVLIDEGLRETHRLLDIGCGPLRAGKLFIAYLMPGNYFGVEPDTEALMSGLQREVFTAKKLGGFTVDAPYCELAKDFDFILAHSVFGHLSLKEIEGVLGRAVDVMTPASKFLFTFKAVRDGTEHRLWEPSILIAAANRAGLQIELLPYKRQWASHQWARVTLR